MKNKQKNKYANVGVNQQKSEKSFDQRPEGRWNIWSQWTIKVLIITWFIIAFKVSRMKGIAKENFRHYINFRLEEIWFTLLLFFVAVGIIITIWCGKTIWGNHKHMFRTSFGEDYLMKDGLFRYTRNPFYLIQILLFVPGLMMFFWPLGIYFTIICTIGLTLYLFFIYLTIREEEKRLEVKYGKTYLDYKKATPRFWPRDWLGFLREARFPTKQTSEPAKRA